MLHRVILWPHLVFGGFNTARNAPGEAREPYDLFQSSRMKGKTPYAVKYGGALKRRPTSRQRHRPGSRSAACSKYSARRRSLSVQEAVPHWTAPTPGSMGGADGFFVSIMLPPAIERCGLMRPNNQLNWHCSNTP
jgi:hypothetical protein